MWGNLAWNEQLGIFLIVVGIAYGLYQMLNLLAEIRDLQKVNNHLIQISYRMMVKNG